MTSNIISNIISLKEKPKYMRFSLVFIDKSGEAEEYIFFDSTISQCVTKSIGFINFMLRIRGMKVVYIFSTNSHSTYRNIYRKADGEAGLYKLIKCQPDDQLDIYDVMNKWHVD